MPDRVTMNLIFSCYLSHAHALNKPAKTLGYFIFFPSFLMSFSFKPPTLPLFPSSFNHQKTLSHQLLWLPFPSIPCTSCLRCPISHQRPASHLRSPRTKFSPFVLPHHFEHAPLLSFPSISTRWPLLLHLWFPPSISSPKSHPSLFARLPSVLRSPRLTSLCRAAWTRVHQSKPCLSSNHHCCAVVQNPSQFGYHIFLLTFCYLLFVIFSFLFSYLFLFLFIFLYILFCFVLFLLIINNNIIILLLFW